MQVTTGCTSREGFGSFLGQSSHEPRDYDNGCTAALAPAEPKDMLTLYPKRLGWEVVPNGKQPWTGATAVEGQRGHVELDATIFLTHEQFVRQRTPVWPSGFHLGPHILQHAVPAPIVDRAAIIGIDQA